MHAGHALKMLCHTISSTLGRYKLLLQLFQLVVESGIWLVALSQSNEADACFSYHSDSLAWTASEDTTKSDIIKNCTRTFMPYKLLISKF